MNYEVNGHNVFMIILVTFLASVILVPLAKIIAGFLGAMDIPNERKVHKKPMPRLGGLAIYFSFLLGYMLYGNNSTEMLSILIGSFIIILLGVIDDIKPIDKASYKFIMQMIAASVVVFYGHIYFKEITFLGFVINFPTPINYIVTLFFIVAITNAINLIDGLDGLAGGISSIYFATIAIIAFILNKLGGLDVTLALIMLGATLGFLVYNFPPAKIFMGDSGSLFLGFIMAVISLLGFKATTLTSFIIPILILSIPIFDIIAAIIRRFLKGESIGKADKEHFHHQLLKMRFSTRSSILIIYAIDILFATVTIFFVLGDTSFAMVIYGLLMLMLLYVVLKTNILFNSVKDIKDNTRVKRIIRGFVVFILFMILFIVIAIYNNSKKVIVLSYNHMLTESEKEHYFKDNNSVITVENFEKQIKYLYDHKYHPITIDELKCYVENTCKLDNKSVLITFDDGNVSVYKYALPILEKYGFNAVTFVITSRITEFTQEWNPSVLQFMSKDMLEDIKNNHPLMQIGSHTNAMHSKVNGKEIYDVYSREEILHDLLKSKEIINSNVFSYPFPGINEKYEKLVKEAGFDMAFISNPYGKVKVKDNKYELKRINISNNTNMIKYVLYLTLY